MQKSALLRDLLVLPASKKEVGTVGSRVKATGSACDVRSAVRQPTHFQRNQRTSKDILLKSPLSSLGCGAQEGTLEGHIGVARCLQSTIKWSLLLGLWAHRGFGM